jgi:hypothetical protein
MVLSGNRYIENGAADIERSKALTQTSTDSPGRFANPATILVKCPPDPPRWCEGSPHHCGDLPEDVFGACCEEWDVGGGSSPRGTARATALNQ